MKISALIVPAAIALATVPQVSFAKGCLKGAVVGGVAGHLVKNHGVVGAAAGCAIGVHQANKKERAAAAQQQTTAANSQVANADTPVPAKKKHFWNKS